MRYNMILQELREEIAEQCEEAVLFDNPSFDKSIIGITDDGCVVYSFERMIQEMSEEEGIGELEAQEFIEYNTIRAIPYCQGNKPIIVYSNIGGEDLI